MQKCHDLLLSKNAFHYFYSYKYKSLFLLCFFLKKAKQALGVRFADIVQKIDPPTRLSSSNSSPQINRLGSITNEHDSYYNENFAACDINTHDHQLMSCISTKTTKYHLTPGGGGGPKMKNAS